jgi:uncharacterized protein (DUF58 family)
VTKALLRVLLMAVVVLLASCSTARMQSPKPSASITVHLELDKTTVRAGASIEGVLTITNHTPKAITVSNNECTVNDGLAVGLTSVLSRKFMRNIF